LQNIDPNLTAKLKIGGAIRLINTSTHLEDNFMDTIAHLTKDIIEPRREIIRLALPQIAVDLEEGLHKADLKFPVYLAVPSSGAYITLVTPSDPTEAEWAQVSDILSRLLAERLDGANLAHRDLTCAAANSTPVAAEISATVD
jgi:hypothetical protein